MEAFNGICRQVATLILFALSLKHVRRGSPPTRRSGLELHAQSELAHYFIGKEVSSRASTLDGCFIISANESNSTICTSLALVSCVSHGMTHVYFSN